MNQTPNNLVAHCWTPSGLLNVETWERQRQTLLRKAKQLQTVIGTDQFDAINDYETMIKTAFKSQNISLNVDLDKVGTEGIDLLIEVNS